jgi:hypothetical protein
MVDRSRSFAVATVLALAISVVTGCSSSAPTPEPSISASAGPQSVGAGFTDIEDNPGSGKGLHSAPKDASVRVCAAKTGGWDVVGRVVNSFHAASKYRIYVSLLNARQETRALVQLDIAPVAPGATRGWSTSIPVKETGLKCILRVERYKA